MTFWHSAEYGSDFRRNSGEIPWTLYVRVEYHMFVYTVQIVSSIVAYVFSQRLPFVREDDSNSVHDESVQNMFVRLYSLNVSVNIDEISKLLMLYLIL